MSKIERKSIEELREMKGIKASLLEEVLYIEESSIGEGEGWLEVSIGELEKRVKLGTELRYNIEEDTSKRQPIPYVLIKRGEEYYLAYRGKGGGESRLYGRLGLLGGHIGVEDIKGSLEEVVRRAMYRELYEEVGLTEDKVSREDYIGCLRLNNEGVEKVHLGLVYVIELKDGVELENKEDYVKGKWFKKEDIEGRSSSLEEWCSYVIKRVVK